MLEQDWFDTASSLGEFWETESSIRLNALADNGVCGHLLSRCGQWKRAGVTLSHMRGGEVRSLHTWVTARPARYLPVHVFKHSKHLISRGMSEASRFQLRLAGPLYTRRHRGKLHPDNSYSTILYVNNSTHARSVAWVFKRYGDETSLHPKTFNNSEGLSIRF